MENISNDLTMPSYPAVQTKPKVMTRIDQLVLGIDAGATKTMAAIGNATTLLSTGRSGAGNLHAESADDVAEHVTEAVRKACQSFGRPVDHFVDIVVGMAGIDSPQDQIRAERLLKKTLGRWMNPRTNLTVLNDIHIVRRSGSQAPYGLALIAGTGSHCFGIHPDGDIAYAGGLEYILADEGSGYDMGLKALRAAIRSADGRTKQTALEKIVLNYFKVKSTRALEPLVYHSNHLGKTAIAKLAKLVDAAAANGDWRAKAIIDETIAELVLHVQAVVQRLQMEKMRFDLVIVGGLFDITAVPFLPRFEHAVKKVAPQVKIIRPTQPPVWGAVQLAQQSLV